LHPAHSRLAVRIPANVPGISRHFFLDRILAVRRAYAKGLVTFRHRLLVASARVIPRALLIIASAHENFLIGKTIAGISSSVIATRLMIKEMR
jgi:hypothetical protein